MTRTPLALRRSPLALTLALGAAIALTACANPTAPEPKAPSAAVRHSGYIVVSGDKDSTSTGGGQQ